MGQVPHGCATTTEAIRRAIQNSQESLRALSKRYGINPKTVAKWKKRGSVVDLPTGPKEPESTSLSLGDEAVIVAFRQHTLLPLDDCLYALQATIPHLTRSSLHRCLQRHGISRLPDVEDGKGIKRKFKAYPIGYGYLEFVRRGLLGAFAELDKIMPRKPGVTLDLSEAEQKIVDVFRRSFEGEKGSEPLYVASFARGKTEDHDNRGMLTLWDRYTKLEGYCLQFREEDVRRIIELEASSRHYAFLTLDHVHYGMDESTSEYRELAFQMNQLLMIEVLKGMPTLPIEPAYDHMWPFGLFATRTLHYISKHKDPFFEDERETRIIGVPAKVAQARILDFPALVKHPKEHADGRQYIGIGEDWRPGLEPCQIIIGPRADKDISDVLTLFSNQPHVINADFPVS